MKRFALATGAFVLCTLLLTTSRAADRGWKLPGESASFAPGPGMELAFGLCVLCHSADYISTQPPMNRVAWTATVTKMKEKYGAPISPEQLEPLVNYLVKTYGTEKQKPKRTE